MPADCSRKTKGAALPSMIGNFGPGDVDVKVVDAESGQRRHQVLDSRHGGAILDSDDDSRVSPTLRASPGIAAEPGKSTRWNTIPVSGCGRTQRQIRRARRCAGRRRSCLIWILSVRCFIIDVCPLRTGQRFTCRLKELANNCSTGRDTFACSSLPPLEAADPDTPPSPSRQPSSRAPSPPACAETPECRRHRTPMHRTPATACARAG